MSVSLVKSDVTASNFNAEAGYGVEDVRFDADYGWLDEYAEDFGFSAVEQGMYDDDPSPYNGDYSEM